ncbi:glycosyltransferase [Polaromonas sp. CG_23.6]|uniref:MraY family glycosyltransferase n=1 Tax=Polaromonas sp. CG_23.6 TaxID=2760709 RepID=UPI002474F3E9|nr:glycosyltransferase [Polaromonas sp. CG_23.6]MDH6186000.1 UDP-N-acetylmuramyl pentapeptide phosphotransferase/UDP-N-acetylglucosamine-1-phosphate transferase [Polaromonas sp. CG_23.6]
MQNFLNPDSLSALRAGSIALLVALLVALLLVRTQRWHGHFSMDSDEGVQKFHTSPTPRVGGIAIAVGVIAGYVFASDARQTLLGPLILAGVPAFAFGLLEDVTKRVSVRSRLLATMGCGVLGWAITGLSITDVNLPGLDWLLGFTVISVLFTAFAVGGIANAINIIDGFNGLAAGTVIIILVAFGAMATALGDNDLAFACLILAGGVFGFLLVNWPMGKIFLGDGGAYFVGFALAWIAVLVLARHAEVSAWAPLLVCGYPILEVLFSIVRRRRRHLSPGDPDRLHLHSLVKRRLARALLPHAGNLARNSVTGSIMWIAALVPAAIAVTWPTHTATLVLGFVVCGLLYTAIYARLTQFRWFFQPVTLTTKTRTA